MLNQVDLYKDILRDLRNFTLLVTNNLMHFRFATRSGRKLKPIRGIVNLKTMTQITTNVWFQHLCRQTRITCNRIWEEETIAQK